ncbi:MAG TPA: hypothetical protein PKC24_16035 [Cyclobacteriaceae bacterium]|nr:hypothetical protein [Cyclobacteriaceae bacterium]
MRRLLLACAVASISMLHSKAQNVTIKRILTDGNFITVVYDLDDSNPNHEYFINLHSSADNFKTPLSKVSGDVGAEVKPGTNKRIRWNIVEEYGSYSGDIWLEIRGRVFVPFVKLQSFGEGRKTFKRGKGYELKWRPGNTNPVHVELFRGGSRVQGELNLPNNGAHRLNFASNLKPGANYRLKITDSRKSDDFVFTENFKVKRKFPAFFKVVPLLGAGALIYLNLGSSGNNDIAGFPEVPSGQ